MNVNPENETGQLFLVAVPIGNPEDITVRAIKTFKSSDIILAENPCVTERLLQSVGLEHERVKLAGFASSGTSQKLKAGTEHGYPVMEASEAVHKLLSGQSICLVSDAGTPVIADPGHNLVALCIENGIKTVPVPGPSAMAAAISVSGVYAGRFCFEGFLSVNRNSRVKRLNELRDESRPIIFYEAPKKLLKTVRDLLEVLGDRPVSVSKDLTKPDEKISFTTLSQFLLYLRSPEFRPEGEYVLIVGPEQKSVDKTEKR